MQHSGFEKFISSIKNDIESINFGEKSINTHSTEHTVTLKNLMKQQKSLFETLSQKTQNMKTKISEFEELNSRLVSVKQKIEENGENGDGVGGVAKLRERFLDLKKEIEGMNVKQALVEKQLLKHLCVKK